MKNSRLLLLMGVVGMFDWVITKVSLKQAQYKAIAQVDKKSIKKLK